jgi:diketogulonate reductase-like aldo/keto reductase
MATLPSFLYGTAWKEDRTEALVLDALEAGFRAIDTANQRKHYHEAGVGRALARCGVPRDQLFLQTKFTFVDGQDHRLPYDPKARIADQVAQSFDRSLEHLGVDTLDSLVLHGPSQRDGLGANDREAWRAMEALVDTRRVRLLGISNVTARQVSDLVAFARIAPRFVQNRCYAERAWDRTVRAVCAEHAIIYQAFSLLTANRQVLADSELRAIAKRHAKTPAQIVFRFAQQVGMLPLTGTSNRSHMQEDLAIGEFALAIDEIGIIDGAGAR